MNSTNRRIKKGLVPEPSVKMKARDYAIRLLKYERAGDMEGFRAYLGQVEMFCCRVGASLNGGFTWQKMRAANERWQAVYKAYRTRNSDQPPPEPFYWSLPYLTVLRNLLAKREQLGTVEFWKRIVELENEVSAVGAKRCVTFKDVFENIEATDFDPQFMFDFQGTRNRSLEEEFNQYLGQGSFS